MSDNSDVIFREVDEEVRRDQLMALWKRYGGIIITVLGLALIGAGGYTFWQSQQESQRRDSSALYEQTVQTAAVGDPALAADAYAAAAERMSAGYKMLARLREAAVLLEAGRRDAAVALYDAIARDAADARLQSLARYLAAAALADTAQRDEVIARLQPLSTPDNPLYFSVRELLGALAVEAGDWPAAREHFTVIAESPTAPPSLRGRAADMLAVITDADARSATNGTGAATTAPAAQTAAEGGAE